MINVRRFLPTFAGAALLLTATTIAPAVAVASRPPMTINKTAFSTDDEIIVSGSGCTKGDTPVILVFSGTVSDDASFASAIDGGVPWYYDTDPGAVGSDGVASIQDTARADEDGIPAGVATVFLACYDGGAFGENPDDYDVRFAGQQITIDGDGIVPPVTPAPTTSAVTPAPTTSAAAPAPTTSVAPRAQAPAAVTAQPTYTG